ncbi:hypothetical protein LPC_0586 [Legionella pneumophila str. Corby]|nr:hypothetical protein LPC_0586 [Legionella pneumophila str. Corby]
MIPVDHYKALAIEQSNFEVPIRIRLHIILLKFSR